MFMGGTTDENQEKSAGLRADWTACSAMVPLCAIAMEKGATSIKCKV